MSTDLKQEFTARITDFFKAFNGKDSEAYMAFYTDDCYLYSPNQDTCKGKADVTTALKELLEHLDNVNSKLVGVDDLIQLSDDYVWADLHTELYNADGNLEGKLTDVLLWKKVDGVWLIHRNAWTQRKE